MTCNVRRVTCDDACHAPLQSMSSVINSIAQKSSRSWLIESAVYSAQHAFAGNPSHHSHTSNIKTNCNYLSSYDFFIDDCSSITPSAPQPTHIAGTCDWIGELDGNPTPSCISLALETLFPWPFTSTLLPALFTNHFFLNLVT